MKSKHFKDNQLENRAILGQGRGKSLGTRLIFLGLFMLVCGISGI